MMTPRVGSTLLATVVALAALSGVAQAVPVSYTIDPLQSTVTSSGWIFAPNFPFLPQYDATNTNSLQGTIVGDLNLGVLTATAGSLIDLPLHPQAGTAPFFQPAGPGEDNIAIMANTQSVIGVAFLAAIRDIAFTIPAGGTMTNGAPAVINLQILPGATLNTNLGSGALNSNAPNVSLGNVTISNNGLVETITIPVMTSSLGSGPANLSETTARIVATRPIPEPSTFVLAGLGIAGMALVAWKKRHAA